MPLTNRNWEQGRSLGRKLLSSRAAAQPCNLSRVGTPGAAGEQGADALAGRKQEALSAPRSGEGPAHRLPTFTAGGGAGEGKPREVGVGSCSTFGKPAAEDEEGPDARGPSQRPGPLAAHLEVVTQHHVCPPWLDLAPALPLLSSPPWSVSGVPPALDVAPFLHHFSRSALSSEE